MKRPEYSDEVNDQFFYYADDIDPYIDHLEDELEKAVRLLNGETVMLPMRGKRWVMTEGEMRKEQAR